MAALDLGTRVAWVRHVIHKDINVTTGLGKLSIDQLEDKKTGFYMSLANVPHEGSE